MHSGIRIFIIALTASVTAVLTLLWAFGQNSPLLHQRIGAWVFYPEYGTQDATPYVKAILALNQDFPIGRGEGVEFLAQSDTNGLSLDLSCRYTLSGKDLPGQVWTLVLRDATGQFVPNAFSRFGYNSQEVLRDENGHFTITISPQTFWGNWLPTSGEGAFELILRLYGLESADISQISNNPLIHIARDAC